MLGKGGGNVPHLPVKKKVGWHGVDNMLRNVGDLVAFPRNERFQHGIPKASDAIILFKQPPSIATKS